MPEKIIKYEKSSEEEIEIKRLELSRLENELSEAELSYATLESELHYFEKYYRIRVGAFLVELDDLNARIAEALAILSPDERDFTEKAKVAREQADATFNATYDFFDDNGNNKNVEKFTPSDDLQRLYRQAAKEMHPDLAKNEEDRELRNDYMTEVNRAYRDQNLERLNEILSDWEQNLEHKPISELVIELDKLNRMILRLKQKIREIKKRTDMLNQSEIGQLKISFDQKSEFGHDLLSQISIEIQSSINKKQKKILRAVENLSS